MTFGLCECVQKRPVIRFQLVVRESEDEKGNIAPVWNPGSAQGISGAANKSVDRCILLS